MFYMNFEASSDIQRECVEAIKKINLDDMSPIYLLKTRKRKDIKNLRY